ncbi:MAG: two-component sensor histidine kinase, partial [Firmicutes bacterium HGW-Firmicutes-5]
ERLKSCHDEILRIGKIIQDLENLAKVESDNLKLDKTQINLNELSEKAVGNFAAEIDKKKLNVSIYGESSDTYADQNRVSQVIINLVSNAVKYTPEHGIIKIFISEDKQFVRLSVSDNGIGIPEDELPYVFERFYRADKSRNRMTGGSGIGLAIVKSIVTAHGGMVEAESHLNEGSRFVVKLPKNKMEWE